MRQPVHLANPHFKEAKHQAMDTSQLPGRGIKPLRSLRTHYRVSAFIWLLVLLAGLPVVWIKGQSYYGVESVFQVSPNYMKTLSTDKEVELQSNSQYREFVNHLSSTVKRYDVLQRALMKMREAKVDAQPKDLSERKYIEQLQKSVTVKPVADTYMVRIGLEGQKKELLAEIVNAVTSAFLETTKSEQIFGSVERLEMLQANAGKLQKEIADLEAQRVQLAERLGLTTFGDNAINPYDGLRDKNQNSDLYAMVDSLDEREAEIIRLRFGLDGKDELTLEEVGKKFHVTRERIRQLEYLALSKMRRAMAKHEAVRTSDEIEEDERVRQRNAVIRDFIEAKSRKPAPVPAKASGRN